MVDERAGASTPDRRIPVGFGVVRSAIREARRIRAVVTSFGRAEIPIGTVIGEGFQILSPRQCRLGRDVYVGSQVRVECDLWVGADVLISSRVAFIGNDHEFETSPATITGGGRLEPSSVVLEGNNLIGFGTVVIAPAVIGHGCVVGAGSLVVGDLPADTVCWGRPARPMRERGASSASLGS